MPPRSEGAQSEDPYLARYDGCEMTPAKLVKALNTCIAVKRPGESLVPARNGQEPDHASDGGSRRPPSL